tara:strand:+ start:552 stop:728 length:177 start_codon:yes stop_codon:yes gene_type:complete
VKGEDGEELYQCGGCNWECNSYYTFEDNKNEPESWLCATCMIDIIEGKEFDMVNEKEN